MGRGKKILQRVRESNLIRDALKCQYSENFHSCFSFSLIWGRSFITPLFTNQAHMERLPLENQCITSVAAAVPVYSGSNCKNHYNIFNVISVVYTGLKHVLVAVKNQVKLRDKLSKLSFSCM